jgi:hypothetical protein
MANKYTSIDKYRSNRGVNFPNKKNPSRSEGTGVNLALFDSKVSQTLTFLKQFLRRSVSKTVHDVMRLFRTTAAVFLNHQ